MHNRKSIAATTIALVGASILTLATLVPGDAIAQTRRNNSQLNELLRQGRELVEAGSYRQALQVYHQAVYIDQSNPKIYSGIGYLHTLDGDYSSAAQFHEYALVLEPRSLPFQYALGFCYAQLGRNREAELAYRQALQLSPNHVESHLGLGVVLMRQGQHRSAYAQYQAAARLDPQNGDVFGMMATALLEQDRTTEAIRLLQDATQRYPRNGRLWLQLGIFLIGTTDDQTGALQALSQAARLDPNNPDIHIQLGSILKEQGNNRDAQRLFYRAITSTPDTYAEQVRMGDLLYNQAVYAVAVLAYRRATELEPNNPKGFHRLGLALQGRSRELEAQSAWETAQDLYRRQGNENGAELMEALLDGKTAANPASNRLIRTTMRVGILGTGLMGQPLAIRLLAQGHSVTAYNRTITKLEPIAAAGGAIAPDVLTVVQRSEVIILMLTNATAIASLLLTPELCPHLAGKTVIQMGTIAPTESRTLHQQITEAQGAYLEAPVLGSIPQVKDGTLLVMVGSTPEQYQQCLPLFQVLGSNPLHIGAIGSAAALKLALNQLIGSLTTAFALSLSFVQQEGVPVETFMTILRESALYAPTFDKKLKRMVEGNFTNPNFPAKHLLKDMKLFSDAAPHHNTEIVRGVIAVVENAIAAGHADDDYSALFNVIETSHQS